MDAELLLQLSEEEADTARLAEVTGYLRAELLQLDVENVTTPQSADVPRGARVVSVAAVGTLLVALGQSVDGLRSVMPAITDWLRRGEGTRRTVRLELDGDALELSQASAADQERLIELFVSRQSHRRRGRAMAGQRKALIVANDTYEQEALGDLQARWRMRKPSDGYSGTPRSVTSPYRSCTTSPPMSSRRRSKRCSRKAGPTTCCCCISPVTG
jgi:hypothetical protein